MIGTPRVHHRAVDSTNERARELAVRGAPHGTLVTAVEQTQQNLGPIEILGSANPFQAIVRPGPLLKIAPGSLEEVAFLLAQGPQYL